MDCVDHATLVFFSNIPPDALESSGTALVNQECLVYIELNAKGCNFEVLCYHELNHTWMSQCRPPQGIDAACKSV
jgi:hypothetical protein